MKIQMESARSCCWPKPRGPRPSLRSILLSFIGLGIKIWHRNKTSGSELNPVQSSRSKSTTCTRKGRLLRLELSSTATSDGGAQKLGNDVWHDSELITTKVCSKIGRKWNATCLRKGRLLRFKLNSTATSDGGAQKLWNDVWRDSKSIATKPNRSEMKCYVCKPCRTSVDRTSFNFWFEDFLSYLTW